MDELARRRALRRMQEQKPRELAVITRTSDGIVLNATDVLLDTHTAGELARVLLEVAADLDAYTSVVVDPYAEQVRKVLHAFKRETSRTGIDAIHAVHDIALILGVEMYPPHD